MASTLSGLSNLNWSPQGLMGSFQSMGAKATSPATNVTPPSNTIKPNLATPNTPSGLSLASYNKSTQASNPGLFGSPTTAQMAANRAATVAGSNGMLKDVNGQVVSASQPTTSNGGSSTSQPIPPATPTVTTPPNVYTQSTQNLSNTQPTTGTTNAIGTSQGIANNQGANASAGTPAAYANTATTGLLGISQNQTPAVVQAEQNVANFNATNPLMKAQQEALPMAAEISSGRGQILGNTLANTGLGLANTLNAAIQGEGQQITAGNEAGSLANTTQGQQLTGANQAGNIANTAQSNQITGQSNAANVTQPSVAGYGQTSFNPSTNSFGTTGGGSGVSPTDPFYSTMQQYAQMAANGQMSSIPTSITGNSVLNAQMNQMAKAINPNYNPVISSAQSASTASNVQTAGTAATNASNTGYSGAVQEYQNNNANYTALTGISSQVIGTLQNYANTGALTDYNSAINTIQSHLSNSDYQKFVTAIGNAQASYQSILGSAGVTPTKADQDAVNALNPNSSASTIVAALNQLSADAHALIIVPSYQKVQNYKQQLGIQ